MSDFDARKHHPVLYGKLHAPISTDFDIFSDFNPAISHPACAGLALLDKPLFHEITDNNPSPDIKTCKYFLLIFIQKLSFIMIYLRQNVLDNVVPI